ncbi:flagellar biosynthesis anti-sigma factor FlgM [Polynucleobacter sp. MWH-UH2A]|uniref:flagellar biosynthesis anti-sigma factor FlgM n=1 Tax=Polynucleobacter sp. MWH-UH2A TaxID=1855617 RepID=UPI001BFD7A79|nr:flagellar biosynthesis anti-sigma factor FlgM [Polynucleobacter sp. MWH-UH2A]QWD64609.1 flagellar biosynthesis anti-sigma factor FlgM [Polynucleobacter sp. MWH-UH2A]
MKVNENGALIPPNTGVGKPNSGSNSTALNPSANKLATDTVAGPAVNLDISLTAKLAEVQSDSKANKVTDEALIEKLRNQVANGEFKIDYKKISQAMLKDVVAAIGQKPKQA